MASFLSPQQAAGIRGLSAGLLSAGAPRVGMPGPSAWAAGLLGMDKSMQDQIMRERAATTYEQQQETYETGKTTAATAKERSDYEAAAEHRQWQMLPPAIKSMTPEPWSPGAVSPTAAASIAPGAVPLGPAAPAVPQSGVSPEQGAHPMDNMPISQVQMLTGHPDKMVSGMATEYLKVKTRKPDLAWAKGPEGYGMFPKEEIAREGYQPFSTENLGTPAGPYAGKAISAQENNILNTVAEKMSKGETVSPEMAREYSRIWDVRTKPRTITLADGSSYIQQPTDLAGAGFPTPTADVPQVQPPAAVDTMAAPPTGPNGEPLFSDPGFGAPLTGTAVSRQNRKLYRKLSATLTKMKAGISTYRGLLNEFGTEVIPGVNKGKLSSAHMNLLMQAKEFYNLGVLNGPDMEVMTKIINDPTSAITAATLGTSGVLAQLEGFEKVITDHAFVNAKLYGSPLDVIAVSPSATELLEYFTDRTPTASENKAIKRKLAEWNK